jgi:hypothetical protein
MVPRIARNEDAAELGFDWQWQVTQRSGKRPLIVEVMKEEAPMPTGARYWTLVVGDLPVASVLAIEGLGDRAPLDLCITRLDLELDEVDGLSRCNGVNAYDAHRSHECPLTVELSGAHADV